MNPEAHFGGFAYGTGWLSESRGGTLSKTTKVSPEALTQPSWNKIHTTPRASTIRYHKQKPPKWVQRRHIKQNHQSESRGGTLSKTTKVSPEALTQPSWNKIRTTPRASTIRYHKQNHQSECRASWNKIRTTPRASTIRYHKQNHQSESRGSLWWFCLWHRMVEWVQRRYTKQNHQSESTSWNKTHTTLIRPQPSGTISKTTKVSPEAHFGGFAYGTGWLSESRGGTLSKTTKVSPEALTQPSWNKTHTTLIRPQPSGTISKTTKVSPEAVQ